MRSMIREWVVGCGIMGVAAANGTEPRFSFVIPGDDAARNATDFSHLQPRPAGADGFVTIRNGHFFTGDHRLRIWGVNVCFAANAPAKAEAAMIAARLAKLGINGVRFHHHDSQPTPRGVLKPPADGRRDLDGEWLDRQDWFLDHLHRNGIYANLNLHVGRSVTEAEGMAGAKDLPYECRYDKYVLYFEPRLRDELKRFIREYLGHMNPYRKLRRADDPGIAMVEITNENSFSLRGPALAGQLPEPYRREFQRQFNEWLTRRYESTEKLKAAWLANAEPPGLPLAGLPEGAGLGSWKLNTPRDRPTSVEIGAAGPEGRAAVKVRVPKNGAGAMHELMRTGLSVAKGTLYSVEFDVRADQPRRLYIDVSRQGPGDWSAVGLSERIEIGPAWRHVRRQFRATDTLSGEARICFKFGDSDVGFELADVVFRQGGIQDPLPSGQSLEGRSIGIPDAGWPEAAVIDARRFMEDVEAAFIRDVTEFIKRDVGAKMPVTASQITYHGARIVADTCEYADVHAYWQHPRFPRKPWDRRDWTIGNSPMEEAVGRDVLFERAAWRLLDRPYTMSEWNIPAPNDYAASSVPFAALVAALQDWDGLFFFQYASSDDGWTRDHMDGYFSFSGDPAKLALLGAFGQLYRRGDLAPLRATAAGTTTERPPAALGLSRQIGIDPRRTAAEPWTAPEGKRLATPDGTVVWDATEAARAHVSVNTPATRAVWGRVGGQSFEMGGWRLDVGAVERNYAVIVMTSRDGRPLEASERLLLVAVGSAENEGMVWNESRTSVGDRWGRGPTQVNGIEAAMSLCAPVRAVHALDGRGERMARLEVKNEGGSRSWSIGPGSRTVWYEIESDRAVR